MYIYFTTTIYLFIHQEVRAPLHLFTALLMYRMMMRHKTQLWGVPMLQSTNPFSLMLVLNVCGPS